MKIPVLVEVEAPEGATHYFGNLLDEPIFVKRMDVAGGEHWWEWKKEQWYLLSHYRPHWLKEIKL